MSSVEMESEDPDKIHPNTVYKRYPWRSVIESSAEYFGLIRQAGEEALAHDRLGAASLEFIDTNGLVPTQIAIGDTQAMAQAGRATNAPDRARTDLQRWEISVVDQRRWIRTLRTRR